MLMTCRPIVFATLLIGTEMMPDLGTRPASSEAAQAPAPFPAQTGTAPAAPDHCQAHRGRGYGGWYANVLWNDNSDNEDGFIVEWKGPSQEGTVTVPANSIEAFNLPNGTNFRYRVRAFNAYGNSGWSNWAHATTGGIG